MQNVSLVVWLFLVCHYGFFLCWDSVCQRQRYLRVALGHLAPASNLPWTDGDSETLKCEEPCLVFQLMYAEPPSNLLCLWILYMRTRVHFDDFVVYYITAVATKSKGWAYPCKIALFIWSVQYGFDLYRCYKLSGLSSLPELWYGRDFFFLSLCKTALISFPLKHLPTKSLRNSLYIRLKFSWLHCTLNSCTYFWNTMNVFLCTAQVSGANCRISNPKKGSKISESI